MMNGEASGTPNRTGRPINPGIPGQRYSLGLKIGGDIKQQLDAAARAKGRTQSQEAELRLERSFRDDERLTRIENQLDKINEKLSVLVTARHFIPPEERPPLSPDEVIQRFRELRSLRAVASEFLVTTQRIQQIVKAYEKRTGNTLERLKFAPPHQPRVEWRCAGCGQIRRLTAMAAARAGPRCHRCAVRRYSDDEMNVFVTGLLADTARGKWARFAKGLGYTKSNEFHIGQQMVARFLLSERRIDEINQLWPEGAPGWVRKLAAR